MKKINWNKLNKNKEKIAHYKKKYGTRATIYYCEGMLGLRKGEFMKYRPRIRRVIKKY